MCLELDIWPGPKPQGIKAHQLRNCVRKNPESHSFAPRSMASIFATTTVGIQGPSQQGASSNAIAIEREHSHRPSSANPSILIIIAPRGCSKADVLSMARPDNTTQTKELKGAEFCSTRGRRARSSLHLQPRHFSRHRRRPQRGATDPGAWVPFVSPHSRRSLRSPPRGVRSLARPAAMRTMLNRAHGNRSLGEPVALPHRTAHVGWHILVAWRPQIQRAAAHLEHHGVRTPPVITRTCGAFGFVRYRILLVSTNDA